MPSIKLFNIKNSVEEITSGTVALEKELQTIIEKNMPIFFGITFLASEYVTTNGGRMDSIGIDENYCPVIFEYKRSVKDNVINQGLFYLDWLLDHKDSFKVLVIEKLGMEAAAQIDWSMPRVICVANDFTKYDESAIKQLNKNISLIRYIKFGNDLLMFEQITENVSTSQPGTIDGSSFEEKHNSDPKEIQFLYEDIRNYILSQGDDITENHLKHYVAFRKIKNFVCAEAYSTKVTLHLKLDVHTIQYEKGFSRDVSGIGHYATGDVEITIKNNADFEKAKPFIDRAYEEN